MNFKIGKAIFLILVAVSISETAAIGDESRYQVPEVEIFRASPTTVDLSSQSPVVNFELRISHNIGIKSDSTTLWLNSQDKRFLASAKLEKTETFVKADKTIAVFKGSITVPSYFDSGIYDFYAEPIEGLPARNSNAIPRSQNLFPDRLNDFAGAEKSILVRIGGELNLKSKTFVGPAYTSETYFLDDKPRNLFSVPPITKVNEVYDPTNFFELRAQSAKLEIESYSPKICSVVNNKLMLLQVGNCDFRVFTKKTKDYVENSFRLNFEVTGARWKPEIDVPKISPQSSLDLPKLLEVTKAYSNNGELVSPVSITPGTCLGAGQYWVKLLSGGTCTLTYRTQATQNNVESDLYTVSFEITRALQSIEFAPSLSVDLKSKTLTLSASVSSGAAVTFAAEPAANCTVTGNTLNLLKAGNCAVTAQQAGTATIAPISKTVTISITGKSARELRTISCVKGSKKVSVTKAKPKCPKGYSRVR
jgi:hypothetical protein